MARRTREALGSSDTFDFVVLGGGSAGCVLAARLSEDGRHRVCLLEAGGSDRHPLVRIPSGVGAAIGSRKLTWGFETVPQPCLDDRRIPLPRGRVLGGSGSINGMAYYRGNARDFDDWAALGNPGWSYAELLPYFLRSEDNPDYPASPFHNVGGPMRIAFVPRPNPLNELFLGAMDELQFPRCADFNVAEPEGAGYRQATIDRGRRVSTASAYLRQALGRANLTVLRGVQARRILLTDGRATGVEFQREGVVGRITATREVIVCAGAYQSPHLLMLSGIGDAASLSAAGVALRHQLPGVGKALQDHLAAAVVMDAPTAPSYGISLRALPRDAWSVMQYLFARRGQIGSNLFETTAYIRSRPGLDRPDMQIVFQPARRNRNRFPLPLGHGYAISVVGLYPESRGTVSLAGPDPLTPPVIDPKLGSAQPDIDTLVRGLRIARQALASPGFARYAAHERSPGDGVRDDATLGAYVRSTAATVHHPAGTCAMGDGANAVVDAELRVRGLTGLRVADASIFPRLIGGNTNAGTVMVGEKAADMILGRAAPRPIEVDRQTR